MYSLPIFVRLTGRPVILIGTGEAAVAKRRLLERAGATVVNEKAPAALAIVAIDDDIQAAAAVSRLRARGILVNAVDRPKLCDFTLPAVIDRDPVLIAIGSGGVSAGLAAALRQRFEALLPASLGKLAQDLFAARAALKTRYPEASWRRRAIGKALSEGGALDALVPQEGEAVTDWLADERFEEAVQYPTVTPIRLTSADPDDLTLRTARLLAQADCLCHSANVPPAILARARADASRIECAAEPQTCVHDQCVFLWLDEC